MIKIIKILLTTIIVVAFLFGIKAQNNYFEGEITYREEFPNPFPDRISDSVWKHQMLRITDGKGYTDFIHYYKENRYKTVSELKGKTRVVVFNPKDSLLYTWVKGTDSAMTLDTRVSFEDVKAVFNLGQTTDTIAGIPAQKLVLSTSDGYVNVWYNPNFFKQNKQWYINHKLGFMDAIIKETGCLPLKIEQDGLMGKSVMTVIAYKSILLTKKDFKISRKLKIIPSLF